MGAKRGKQIVNSGGLGTLSPIVNVKSLPFKPPLEVLS